jgi:ribonuclease-3
LMLGASLFLGRGESSSGGRERSSVVSSAYEAVMAAVYLDGGESALEVVLRRSMEKAIEELNEPERTDYKTRVQELVQAQKHCVPSYRLDREEGPDHQKRFFVSLLVEGTVYSSGSGRSKKEATQSAAKELLGNLQENPSLLN